MSIEYNAYLDEHIENVQRGFEWLCDRFSDIRVKCENERYIISVHDASKVKADEYDAYDKYFYGKNKSFKVVQDFKMAWLRHQHRNPHHWQYWVLIHDDEPMEALEMPYIYVVEMICDWWSFSWKSGNLYEIFDWYEKHRDGMILNDRTRNAVEELLQRMREKLEEQNTLAHHGIKGQKWGVKNGPPYPIHGFNDVSELSEHMKNFKYKEFDKLMSPDEVGKTKSGSCHDQVMYEMQQLRRIGKDPKGLFFIQVNGNQGGTTHSLAYYKEDGKVKWFENAWGGQEGVHEFDSVDQMKNEIEKLNRKENPNFERLEFGIFDDSKHKIGEDLQTLVDICMTEETDASSVAESIYRNAKKHVKKIGDDVTDAVMDAGGEIYGFENRLKTKESIERKINKKAREDRVSVQEAGKDIRDGVRFTTLFSEVGFVKSYNEFKRAMEARGYSEARCKNYFDLYQKGLVKHKAVQSTFRSDDGYEFEVQFQTAASQNVKNRKLPLYEERRQEGISKERAEALERQMTELAENVPNPPGIEKIKSH